MSYGLVAIDLHYWIIWLLYQLINQINGFTQRKKSISRAAIISINLIFKLQQKSIPHVFLASAPMAPQQADHNSKEYMNEYMGMHSIIYLSFCLWLCACIYFRFKSTSKIYIFYLFSAFFVCCFRLTSQLEAGHKLCCLSKA